MLAAGDEKLLRKIWKRAGAAEQFLQQRDEKNQKEYRSHGCDHLAE